MKANLSDRSETWPEDHEFEVYDAVILDGELGWVSGFVGFDLVKVQINYRPKEGELVHHSRLCFQQLYHHDIKLTQIERRLLVYLNRHQDCASFRELVKELGTNRYTCKTPSASKARAIFSKWSQRLFDTGLVREVRDCAGRKGYAQITGWGRDLIRTPPPIERD